MTIKDLSKIKIQNINETTDIHVMIDKFTEDIQESYEEYNKIKNEISTFSMRDLYNEELLKIPDFHFYPPNIQENIKNMKKVIVQFSFSIHNHLFHGSIIIDKNNKIETYFEFIYKWLYVATKYAKPNCSKQMKIFIFTLNKKKILPEDTGILSQSNCNTAFTTSCKEFTEMHIYRNEEWFKVFIHETFHNLAFDFSNISTNESNTILNKLFHTDIDMKLYEAYTEFFAEIFLILFHCCDKHKTKKKITDTFLRELKKQQQFSFFQLTKILHFLNTDYNSIITKGKTNYNEETPVFSYYIIKCILLYNIEDFLQWCKTNNKNFIQFKHENIISFCNFIEKRFNNQKFLTHIQDAEQLITNEKSQFMRTLRMTILDFP